MMIELMLKPNLKRNLLFSEPFHFGGSAPLTTIFSTLQPKILLLKLDLAMMMNIKFKKKIWYDAY